MASTSTQAFYLSGIALFQGAFAVIQPIDVSANEAIIALDTTDSTDVWEGNILSENTSEVAAVESTDITGFSAVEGRSILEITQANLLLTDAQNVSQLFTDYQLRVTSYDSAIAIPADYSGQPGYWNGLSVAIDAQDQGIESIDLPIHTIFVDENGVRCGVGMNVTPAVELTESVTQDAVDALTGSQVMEITNLPIHTIYVNGDGQIQCGVAPSVARVASSTDGIVTQAPADISQGTEEDQVINLVNLSMHGMYVNADGQIQCGVSSSALSAFTSDLSVPLDGYTPEYVECVYEVNHLDLAVASADDFFAA